MSRLAGKGKVSGSRAYAIQSTLEARILDCISTARHFYETSEELSARMCRSVWDDPQLARCPGYVHAYLRGVHKTARDALYRDIAWMLWLDDGLVASKQVDALTVTESTRPRGLDYKSPWSRIDSERSRHVWISRDTGLPMPDKSFDAKWR